MKAVILARVSTEEQKEAGNSLPAQQARLRNYIERNSRLEQDREFIFDESAYKETRHKFDEVIDYLRSFKETVVLCCDKVDRLSRDFLIGLPKLEELRRAGKIELHFPSDNLILHQNSPATDLFHFNIAVSLAQYYSNAISDNTKRVFELKRKNGEITGQAKIGYKIVENENGKKDHVVDFSTAHLVKKLFELFSTGNYSITTVHKKMTELGLKNKKGEPLARSFIALMLKDTFYHGLAYSRKYGYYSHKYSPLITKDLFDKCQEVSKGRNKTRTKELSKEFIFKGLIHCKKCGCVYSPEIKKGRFIYYSCTNARGMCKREYLPESTLLKPVYDVFKAFEGIPEATQAKLVDKLRELNEFEVEYHNKEIKRIRAEYDTTQKKKDALLEMRLELSITKEDYDKKLQELNDKQQRLNIAMEEHTDADIDYKIHVSTVLNLSRRVKQIFDSSEVNEKRALIRFLIQNSFVEDKKLVFELRKPFDTVLELATHPTVLRRWDSNPRPKD